MPLSLEARTERRAEARRRRRQRRETSAWAEEGLTGSTNLLHLASPASSFRSSRLRCCCFLPSLRVQRRGAAAAGVSRVTGCLSVSPVDREDQRSSPSFTRMACFVSLGIRTLLLLLLSSLHLISSKNDQQQPLFRRRFTALLTPFLPPSQLQG